MVAAAKQVGGNGLRESYGRYYEDFTVGDVYEHRPGRTISEADNTWLRKPKGDRKSSVPNRKFAALRLGFGRGVVDAEALD